MQKLLTPTEVVDLLQISEKTLKRLVCCGEINSIRVGRSYRFRVSDVKIFIKRNETVTKKKKIVSDINNTEAIATLKEFGVM